MIDRRTFLLGTAALGLGACGGEEKPDEGPPNISYGNEICDRCNMIIGDERHAAAFMGSDKEWKYFDDCGEMITVIQELNLSSPIAWVHDYEQKTWVAAADAFYVWMPSGNTPMGTGVVAYSDQARAELKAEETSGWWKDWPTMLSDWSMN